MAVKSRNLFHDKLHLILDMYLENDKYQHRNFEIIALIVTPGMQERGKSHHLWIYVYIFSYIVIILKSSLYSILFFPLRVNKYVHKYFKHYCNDGNHLVFKYVFIDVGVEPLVLEHIIHQQRLCMLSKIIEIWHPLTVLFMISLFKDGLLFILILNIFKPIACQTNLSIILFKKGFRQPNTSYGCNACPASSARVMLHSFFQPRSKMVT